jgi:hypothetical protein
MNVYGRVMSAFLKANDPPVERTNRTSETLDNTKVALQRLVEELEAHSEGEFRHDSTTSVCRQAYCVPLWNKVLLYISTFV